MTKKIMIIPIALLGFSLGACQQEEQEAVIETEEVAEDTTDEVTEVEEQDEDQDAEEDLEAKDEEDSEETDSNEIGERVQSLLDQAKREYEAEELDAASGTLSLLLENDLTNHPDILAEAETLKEEIHTLQAENAREVAGAYTETENSEYKDERQSAIISQEYSDATGQSIMEASDEELAEWFAQKESDAEPEEETESWTKEEAENYAFDQLIMSENLNYENYIFFVNLMEDEWVQMEVREPVEQDGVTWSNLIGLYRFNVSTDELQKLDMVTGDYELVR